jgi:hypothetical protein
MSYLPLSHSLAVILREIHAKLLFVANGLIDQSIGGEEFQRDYKLNSLNSSEVNIEQNNALYNLLLIFDPLCSLVSRLGLK